MKTWLYHTFCTMTGWEAMIEVAAFLTKIALAIWFVYVTSEMLTVLHTISDTLMEITNG